MKPFELLFLSLFFLAGCSGLSSRQADAGRPNVLFICIDDFRPELKVYGNPLIQAPTWISWPAALTSSPVSM